MLKVYLSTQAFENLVNYDKSKTDKIYENVIQLFENLVNYDKSKICIWLSLLY